MVAEARAADPPRAGLDPCAPQMPPIRISGSAAARVRAIHFFRRRSRRLPARRVRSRDRGSRTASCTPTASPPLSGARVVAAQRSLALLVEPAVRVERKRMRGNDPAVLSAATDAGRGDRSSESSGARFELRLACRDGRRRRAASSRRSTRSTVRCRRGGRPRSAQPREPLLSSASSASRPVNVHVGVQQPRQLGGSAADAHLFRSRDIDDRRTASTRASAQPRPWRWRPPARSY